jgi:hypothetical protein
MYVIAAHEQKSAEEDRIVPSKKARLLAAVQCYAAPSRYLPGE